MTLTDEQKQALREKTASAKTQSKLEPFKRSAGLEQANLDPYTDENGMVDVSRETSLGPAEHPTMQEEQPFCSRADEQADLAGAAYHDQVAQDVSSIPWNGPEPFQDAEVGTITFLVPMNQQAIVEGFTIPPGMDEEQVLDLSSSIYTYIGPEPAHISRYTNKWFKVLGCCVQPLEGWVVDDKTGDVKYKKWVRPLFKLDKVDPDTGENIIAYGGGTRGLQIVRHFNAISIQFGWTVGDFKRPRMFYVQQENRENAHVMYGFRHRACTDDEMSK